MIAKIKSSIRKKLGWFYSRVRSSAEEFEREQNQYTFLGYKHYDEFLRFISQNQNFNIQADEKRFILFDYKFNSLIHHNLGDFVQTLATHNAIKNVAGGGGRNRIF